MVKFLSKHSCYSGSFSIFVPLSVLVFLQLFLVLLTSFKDNVMKLLLTTLMLMQLLIATVELQNTRNIECMS